MPVIINGSTGISGTDGSAATPAVQGTDINTGMFFPAADQIAFAEGGVESMRIDASGNVGIGTSSPANRLTVNSGATDEVARFEGTGSPYIAWYRSGVRQGYAGAFGGTQVTFLAEGRQLDLGATGANIVTFQTNGNERARITSGGDFQFNSGYGSVATAFGCRAWVNFNGTGTVAIRASGNVSSVTDNGIGLYTLNFSNAMPDANYTVVATNNVLSALNGSTTDTSASNGGRVYTCFMCVSQATPPTATAVRVSQGSSYYAGDVYDPAQVHVAVFR